MFKAPDHADSYIRDFKNNVKTYIEKGEEDFPFKPFGAKMGVYMERSGNTFMVRPRTPGGVVSVDQLKVISSLAKKYAKAQIRFTTRQNIQFHQVKVEDTVKIIEGLKEANVYSLGGGGDTVRNVACSPLSGLEKDEAFDVTPFALEATNYILEDENSVKMPRKLKLSFSNSSKDTGNAAFADLGFIAKTKDGKEGFTVYIGGGFGGGPRASLKLEEFINASDTIYYVDAIKNFFYKEGDRENKARARLRHLVKKFGAEEFKKRYGGYLKESLKKDLKLDLEEIKEKYHEEQNTEISNKLNKASKLIEETKYNGIYAVYIHPRRGKIDTIDLDCIIKFIENLDYKVTLRVTPTQGLVVRGLTGSDSESLVKRISDFTSPYDIDNSLVCVGADTCRTGIGSSQDLFADILTRFKDIEEDIKNQIPKLYVSGCPSSCGQHLRGQIGFSGKRKKIDDKVVSTYAIYFGGKGGEDIKLGTRYGDLVATEIPDFLYELAVLKRDSKREDFEEFFDENNKEVLELVKRYDVS